MYEDPTCPAGCTTAMGTVEFNECAPKFNIGEIAYVYLTLPTQSFPDASVPAAALTEMTTRLAAVDNTKIVKLRVIGSKAAAASTSKPVSGGRTSNAEKTHTVAFRIDETNEVNHEFLRKVECGGRYKALYETAGGYLYGGSGILADLVMNNVIPESREDFETIEGSLVWKNKFTEPKVLTPYN